MVAQPDIAVVSLGTTLGWRHTDESLAAMLERIGCSYEVIPVHMGRLGAFRRGMAATDVIEAVAARRAGRAVRARAVIFSSITAALLQPSRVPYAVRFDTLASLSRPGVGGLWQRLREPGVLARARLLLPFGEVAERECRRRIANVGGAARPKTVLLPAPIARATVSPQRDIEAVAYAANPHKRGLKLLCEAWRRARRPGGRLVVAGLPRDRALRYLGDAGLTEPPGVEWVGVLPHSQWLSYLSRARIFVNASRYEDWGIAQLEALSAGTPLVTVPTPGPNQGLSLARRLGHRLVATDSSISALADAIRTGLALTSAQRQAYARAAEAMLEPYRFEALAEVVRQDVVPALLRNPS